MRSHKDSVRNVSSRIIMRYFSCASMQACTGVLIIRGEPERAPNTRETGSGVYICIYIVRDLAWQRPNTHAQSPRVRI